MIWVGGYQEGKEWGEVFGFVSEGIIRTDEDLAKYNKLDLAAGQVWYGSAAGRRVASAKLIAEKGLTGWISTKKGDVMWKDIDKNDTIDYRDQVSLGRVLPRVTGGFNTTVSYKDFALAARMDFALGHIQRDAMQLWSLGCMQGEFNMTKDVRDTWTPDNPDAKYPRYVWADQLNTKNFDRPSGMFWRKSNYLAFREVTLSYNLPKSMLSRIKIPKAIISVTGQNLGYLSDRLLNLPERTGDQNGAYIIPTQLIFGLDITL